MRNIYLISLILLLSACGNQVIRQDKPQYDGLAQAQIYYQQHNYVQAAAAYEQLYEIYREDEFAIYAADSLLQMHEFLQAKQILSQIEYSNNPLYALIQAEISLNQGDYNIRLNNVDGVLRSRYLSIEARIEFVQQNYFEAALMWIELSELEPQTDVSDDIMSSLLQSTEQQINNALFNPNLTLVEQGWLEAANIFSSQDPQSKSQWKNRWQDHPANVFFVQINQYQNIAVLLPMTGTYKNITKSIKQGMIASLYRDGASQQRLSFFDTGSSGETFSHAWYGAIESGAEFIIGPLEKNSIEQLSQLNSSTVPVLLLNDLDGNHSNPSGFYQFSLSRTDEVINVAARLIDEDNKRIMLLAPESESGRKLAVTFEQEFNRIGGQVVSYQFYPESTHDYSREIKTALGLNESLVRARQLQTMIQTKIINTPQIRPDIDAIFIIAKPQQARLIKPQLKFFQAEKVPVFSTSQLLPSSVDAALNKDLNGIKFCHSAFVIDPMLYQQDLNFDVSGIESNKKFFAFGYDAIAIYPRLEWMQRMQNQKTQGLSGYLSVDGNGRIHRDLDWAQIKNGQAVLLPPLRQNIPDGDPAFIQISD